MSAISRKAEQRVAEYLGMERRRQAMGVTQGPDLGNHPLVEVEVKYRAEHPGWLVEPILVASRWAKSRAKVPVVVWLERGERIENALAVLWLSDLKGLLEAILPPPAMQSPGRIAGFLRRPLSQRRKTVEVVASRGSASPPPRPAPGPSSPPTAMERAP